MISRSWGAGRSTDMTTTFASPIGPLTLHARDGALTAVWMEDDPDLPDRPDDSPGVASLPA